MLALYLLQIYTLFYSYPNNLTKQIPKPPQHIKYQQYTIWKNLPANSILLPIKAFYYYKTTTIKRQYDIVNPTNITSYIFSIK